MNWDPFGLFALSNNTSRNEEKSNVTTSDVMIGQLFEHGPLIEMIEFVSIPLEEKKKKLLIEREKRLKRKKDCQTEPAKRLLE